VIFLYPTLSPSFKRKRKSISGSLCWHVSTAYQVLSSTRSQGNEKIESLFFDFQVEF
jgi:hypothetical protein